MYSSKRFGDACRRWGGWQSMGRVGSCFDNAASKAFNRVLKVEHVHWQHFPSRAETRIKIDSNGYSGNGDELPWLSAQVVVSNDKPQAYGRRTQVWLGYGVHLGELSPAEAREALGEMRGFVNRLELVVKQAEEIARDDFEGDPEIARLDREAEDRRIQAILSSPEHAA